MSIRAGLPMVLVPRKSFLALTTNIAGEFADYFISGIIRVVVWLAVASHIIPNVSEVHRFWMGVPEKLRH